MADGLVILMKWGNAYGGKQLWYKGNAKSGENPVMDEYLVTPINKVQADSYWRGRSSVTKRRLTLGL